MPEEKVAEALELDTRRRIYQHLHAKPGAHMREVARELGMPMGTLEYHLHYLEKAGLLATRADGRYTRYFVVGDLGRREKDVLSVLRQEVPRRIAAHLLLHPGASHGEILTQFSLSASTLSFHLKKLLNGNVARKVKEGRENRYWIEEPDLVAKVLVTYRESFFDDVINRFADVWLSMEPRGGEEDEGAPPGGAGGLLVVLVRAFFAPFSPAGAA